ncbi:diguanylate cyclase [Acetomicrobium sp.]|uniref:TackOD1 domain-containing metal-binding protein n=1 Tax=Acetomicrobium sp. TaxID=1872099 RepID=UPI001BCECCB6|nr:diguanylate cyclase [Acetomicrobium sp.]
MTEKDIKFIRFALAENPCLNRYETVRDVHSIEELTQVMEDADAFIIDGSEPEELACQVSCTIRSNPSSCAKPLFTTSALPEKIALLCDGEISSMEEAVKKASQILNRLNEANQDALKESPDFRLMAYLYARPSMQIKPLLEPFTPHAYRYPLASCLSEDPAMGEEWLGFLKQKGLLEFGDLIDRIRLCPRCETSHLNYIDICPNCSSLDIVRKEFIHCFTCGRVGPVEDFLLEDHLRCPFCHTRLRHLGEDYDHPMESHSCNDCGHRFIDPDVVVDCFNCRTRSDTDELIIKNIYGFKITNKGKTAARVGTMEDVYSIFDSLNYMAPPYFSKLMNWLLDLHKRYPQDNFSVVGIYISNLPDIALKLGREKTLRLANEIARRLRQLIRGTDVSTRTSINNLWLLLPKTDKAGANVLAERIKNLSSLIDIDYEGTLEFKIALFSTPDDLMDADDAERILARLSGELGNE